MTSPASETPAAVNFLRKIVSDDLASGKHQQIVTRFPPEPNGFLHIGHAKSICLNFGLAEEFGGVCHLRFDDTNPSKEEQAYIDSIQEDIKWLGFRWHGAVRYASNYFEQLYQWALHLIESGKAYVCDLSPDEARSYRGSLTEPGKNSPYRERSVAENLDLFKRMKAGEFAEGSRTLRAKIDMASGNINLRDPVLYRIRFAHHHQTGDAWCIYPSYDFTHGQSDAIEGITHSICTLEFEDHRPLYEWFLQPLPVPCQPRQYEFARLNLSHCVTSKRKLARLVAEGYVDGWDDPRMPTLAGLRRRGYTPASIRLLCERSGVSKSNSRIDYSLLDQALRDDLDPIASRSVAVLQPLKLVITNYPEGQSEACSAPVNPHDAKAGVRSFPFSRELWIEQDDFRIEPPKKYFRLFPGNKVRLKYGYVVQCTGYTQDEHGNVVEVQAEYLPDTKSGTPGADSVKVKGNITWVSAAHAVPARIRLYDRLFADPHPDAGDKDFISALNPNSIQEVQGWLEPGIHAAPGATWQFERLGYFMADSKLSSPESPVLNRIATLRDSW